MSELMLASAAIGLVLLAVRVADRGLRERRERRRMFRRVERHLAGRKG